MILHDTKQGVIKMVKDKKVLYLITAVVIVLLSLIVTLCIFGGSNGELEKKLELGQQYINELDYEQALATFKETIEIDKYCAQAYIGMADAYVGLGDLEAAENILRIAIDALTGNGSGEKISWIQKIKNNSNKQNVDLLNDKLKEVIGLQTGKENENSDKISEEENNDTADENVDRTIPENPQKINATDTEWSCVWFGKYWQTDTNNDGQANEDDEKEPIKWRVLSVNDDAEALLLSDKILDYKKWHGIEEDFDSVDASAWDTSQIRSWLNGYSNISLTNNSVDGFYNIAFNESEKNSMLDNNVDSDDWGAFEQLAGSWNGFDFEYVDVNSESTNDKVYLMSLSEINNEKYGFDNVESKETYCNFECYEADDRRKAEQTEFSSERIKKYLDDNNWDEDDTDVYNPGWWLRSLSNGMFANAVTVAGEIDHGGEGSAWQDSMGGIRPIIKINLKQNEWCYAGTTCASGEVDEVICTLESNGQQE